MTVIAEQQADPILEKLTGPGGDYEIVEENVLGQPMRVFRNRYRSLPELLVDSQKWGDREFMIDGDRRITYRQHFAMVKAVTKLLREEYGVGKGDRIAIFAENSIEWDVAFWSAMSLGAVLVAMNGWWTAPEFQYAWELTEPKLLLGDTKRLQRLDGIELGVPVLDMAERFIPQYPEHRHSAGNSAELRLPIVDIDEDDPALIMFTSGTTGKPKGAVISHRTEIGFSQCTVFTTAYAMAQWGLSLADRPAGTTLGTSPFFHISGLGGLLLLTRINGDKVVLYHGRFDPDKALSLIAREKVSTWTALGGMGPKIISCENLEQYDLSSLTTLIFGGSPVSERVMDELRKIFSSASAATAIGYGSTETGSIPVGFAGQEYVDRPTSTGNANILHELQIRDDSGRVLADGEEGHVWVRSPFIMLGYWKNPEATAEVIDEQRWYKTGDIGHLEDGYLYLNARARDMIIRSAENIYPIEIENRLDSHPAVRESAVYGVDDPVHGQAVKAVVVLKDNSDVSELELAEWARAALAGFKVPEHWELTRELLPRNVQGKVLKDQLRG